MTDKEQKLAAKKFSEFWKDKGYEKGQSQVFWYSLLNEVLGVQNPKEFIEFEDQVHIDKSTGFIDGYIPSTKVLIEQKSIDKDLRKAIKQSDGSLLTPFQQAKKYIAELPVSKHPKWVITCNFKEFYIYDMEKPNGEPEIILLENLEKEYYRLEFIVDTGNSNLKREMEISIQAGELVGKIYDEILPLYRNPEDKESLRSLNMLCVRLVFCLYAEDAGLFGKHNMFHDYLDKFEAEDIRRALIDLFRVLDTKTEDRDPYMKEDLAQFPYVNGGLFANENIEIPMLNDKVKELLLTKASEDFDWSDISPTIFGAVFESTLNPETRRSGGMHYTSIENIHKVIDPLFLDELKEELENKVLNIKTADVIEKNVQAFQEKISNLKFLDPACGSGNFLTETYLSLRKLENQALEKLYGGQIRLMDMYNPIKVSISQFFGIEINDFAVTVAKTALWIAESQMMKETEDILHINLDFLPLKSYTNITEANALRIDWNEVVDKNELNYIMGNPPFVGGKEQSQKQKEEITNIFGKKFKGLGHLDYVSGWYKKASEYISSTNIECSFVSTSSVVQGEHVSTLWKDLFENNHIVINYAYRTFNWASEAKKKAAVHCVIISFAIKNKKVKKIYSEDNKFKMVSHINAYLMDAPDIYAIRRSSPIQNVPIIGNGNVPLDNAICTFTFQEKENFIKKEPNAKSYFYRYMGAYEFINNVERYFLLIKKIPPEQLRKMPFVLDILKKIREYRLNSGISAQKLADTPSKFHYENIPEGNFLVIPTVSSSRRKYIPIGFLSPDVLVNNQLQIMNNGGLFEFGILSSNVHNSWMRVTCGRLRNDFRYSVGIVYNNFPYPEIEKTKKERIEKTAQAILDARALYPNSSFADLYDELTMPVELRKAHQENDKAVMEAYGFDWRKMSESDCVAELMKMYEMITKKGVENN